MQTAKRYHPPVPPYHSAETETASWLMIVILLVLAVFAVFSLFNRVGG